MSLAPFFDQTLSPEMVLVRFRFQVNGTSDPDFLMPGNCGVTDITRTGVGAFSITFATKWPKFVGARGATMPAAVGDYLVVATTPGSYSATTGVLTITTVDVETPAATEPTDNDWVYIEALFCRRSQLAPTVAI